jgi:hypothetical protein
MTDQMQQGMPAQKIDPATIPFGQANNNERPHLVVDNTLHNREKQIAKDIVSSTKPVIIITQDGAKTYGRMSKYITSVFPKVPVVFESAKAEKDFFSAQWCERAEFKNRCVGHFEKVCIYTTQQDQQTCQQLKSANYAIVLGKPTADLINTIEAHNVDYAINSSDASPTSPRINFAIIERMNRPEMAWDQWRAHLKQGRSL